MRDTAPAVEKFWLSMFTERTPAERLQMASDMFETAKQLMEIGIRRQDPGITAAQLKGKIFMGLYGNGFSADQLKRIASAIPDMELKIEG